MDLKIRLLFIAIIIFSIGCAGKAFEQAQRTNTVEAYNQFLKDYGDSEYAKKAKELREKAFYKRSIKTDTIDSYDSYLKKYPNGGFVNEIKTAREKKWFDNTKQENSIKSYDSYLKEYPNGKYVNEAQKTREELWFNNAKKLNTTDSYRGYLKAYPDGKFIEEANQLIIKAIEAKLQKHDINKIMYTKDSQRVIVQDIENDMAITDQGNFTLSDLQKVAYKANGYFTIDTGNKKLGLKDVKIINSLIFQDQEENKLDYTDFREIPKKCQNLNIYGLQWRLPDKEEYDIGTAFNQFENKYFYPDGYSGVYVTSTSDYYNAKIELNLFTYSFHSNKKARVGYYYPEKNEYLYRCVTDIPKDFSDLTNQIFLSKLYPSWPLPEKPVKQKYYKFKELIKGEFETKEEFQKRTNKEKDTISQKNLQIDSDYQKAISQWEENLERRKVNYQKELNELKNKKNELMLESIKISKIISLSLNNISKKSFIKICKADYNADDEYFEISICELPEGFIKLDIPMKRKDAKVFKEAFLKRTIKPVLKYQVKNNVAEIIGIKQVQEPEFFEIENTFEYAYNSYENLKEAIEKHPNYLRIEDAKERLAQLKIAKEKKEADEREKQEEERKEREEKLKEQRAFTDPKNIGDLVCQKGTAKAILFFSSSYSMKGYVEAISGSKIQIKLTDVSGIGNYNDVNVYSGISIWDHSSNWRLCNY